MGMGSSIAAGAGAGAAAGTAILPGWGTAAGAVVGGIVGTFKGMEEKKREAELDQLIADMPKFEDSASFNTSLALMGRADRRTQNGLAAPVYNRQIENINQIEAQGVNQAQSVDDVLLGGSKRQRTLADMYKDLAMADANAQIANEGAFNTQANKGVDAMQTAFEFDQVRPIQQQMDMTAAKLGRSQEDYSELNNSLQTGTQNYMNYQGVQA